MMEEVREKKKSEREMKEVERRKKSAAGKRSVNYVALE